MALGEEGGDAPASRDQSPGVRRAPACCRMAALSHPRALQTADLASQWRRYENRSADRRASIAPLSSCEMAAPQPAQEEGRAAPWGRRAATARPPEGSSVMDARTSRYREVYARWQR